MSHEEVQDMDAAARMQGLKNTRKASRRAATTSINAVADLLQDKDANNRSALLKGHLAVLQSKLEKLEIIEEQIMCQLSDEDGDTESTSANQYCLNINVCIAEIITELEEGIMAKPQSSPQHQTPLRAPAVKLPKVNIEAFSGDLTAYPTFIDAYESIIHVNKTLSNVEKFYYLKGLLKGKAANTIEGLSMTNDNYESAIDLIKSRFGSKKRLQSHFIDALMKLKPIENTKDLKGLRILHDKIESITRNLKTLGIDDNTYGPLLMPCVLQKLPSEISLAITKSSSEDSWDFHQVITEFEHELSARERCQSVKSLQEERQSSTSSKHKGSTFHTQTGTQHPCTFCKGSHPSWQCDSVTDVKQRRKIVMQERRCYNCLRKNHQQNECKSKFTCRTCNGKHHSALCESDPSEKDDVTPTSTSIAQHIPEDPIYGAVATTGTTNVKDEIVLLKTAIVEAINPREDKGQVARGRLLFDDASTKTYVTKELADRMKLEPIHTKKLVINGACNKSTTIKCPVVQLNILTTEKETVTITASVLKSICHPLETQHLNLAQKEYSHLKSIQIADTQKDDRAPKQVDILIGGDFYYSFMPEPTEVKRPLNGHGPVAIRTHVGWVVSGPVESSNISVNSTNLTVEHAMFTESITNKINTMWDLDTIGIKLTDDTYENFVQDLKLKDGRYEVSLPWKKSHQLLPDNYNNSMGRLQSNLRKLKRDPTILKQYNEIIKEQVDAGVIEKRCGNEPVEEKLHYLPHRAVIKEERATTKLRVVYDASSKVAKHLPSVNDCLMKGPSLNPLLFDVLLRFRIYPTAFICDIMKGFLQILVNEHDRDALRFLWVDDPFSDDPEVIIYRFTRIVFGLNCSPFLFSATLREHFLKFKENNSGVIEAIIRSLYVDDFVGGGQDTQSSFEIYKSMTNILKKGGFDTHKFVTNDKTLEGLVSHPEANTVSSESYAEQTLGHESDMTKVLGIPWCNTEDNLIIEFQHIVSLSEETVKVTKRTVLSLLASLYDPLGLVSPVAMRAKVIFQEACRRKVNWDDQLPEDLINEFTDWLENLRSANSFTIPRCYVKKTNTTACLIGFSDASQIGYSAVVYLRFKLLNGKVQTMLVASKARVAPLKEDKEKPITIPRLELIGCLILSRLMDRVKQAFKHDLEVTSFRYYTDSTINLHRIKGLKQYKQFVENRIAEIRTKSDPSEWYFVPGEFNAADLPSRGGNVSELDETWIRGPKFIQRADIQVFPYDCAELESDKEEKTTILVQNHLLIHAGSIPPAYFTSKNTRAIDAIIDPARYSNLQKLLYVTAYVLRFASRVRTKGDLTRNELEEARLTWIRSVQYNESKSNQANFKKTANNLRLMEDERGVLRCQGRLSNADLSFDQRHPIYLPVSPIAKLIVLEAHAGVFHQKTRSTLTQVRSAYWVPCGRRYVASILKGCYICKLLDTNPYPLPIPPNLPEFRVEFAPAFSNIGTDHVGPFYTRGVYGNKKLHKCYVSIYSCCVTRAIHIELQPSLEAPATIRAMKRAFARMGTPKLIVSDNHKTYKATSVQTYARNRGIEWHFILPLSPHWGGFYERMNGLIKRALNKSLRNTQVSYEEFETILTEIESMINSRPLCYVYEDDMAEPLTPSHLIYGRRLNSSKEIRPVNTQASILDDNLPSKRVRYVDSLLNRFWERFHSEYLTSLRERETTSSQSTPNLKIGDVVLIKENNVSRMEWPLGRVIRLITSEDKVTRGAVLQTKDGVRKRPINKLCPLEIQQDDSEKTEGIDTNKTTTSDTTTSESIDATQQDSAAASDAAQQYSAAASDAAQQYSAAASDAAQQYSASASNNYATRASESRRPLRAAARTGQLLRRMQEKDENEEDF